MIDLEGEIVGVLCGMHLCSIVLLLKQRGKLVEHRSTKNISISIKIIPKNSGQNS
jgi:hypothetical protein